MHRFITCCAALFAAFALAAPAGAQDAGTITGTVTDRHTGGPVAGACAVAYPLDTPDLVAAETVTDEAGAYAMAVAPGSYRVAFFDCDGFDYAASLAGGPVEVAAAAPADASAALGRRALPGLVDTTTGRWYLALARQGTVESFIYGNPGDLPMVGDWDCDGIDTPGLYRQSDGYVYLRNSNTQGTADVRFYFGDPGDVPLAGDFDGDGCDTVSIYRPSTSEVFVINELGSGDAGLGAAETSFPFGTPGDQPFVGDFDGDGADSVAVFRPAEARIFLRTELTRGPVEHELPWGGPGDVVVAGDFAGLGVDTPASWRPDARVFAIAHDHGGGEPARTEAWGFAPASWAPVAGRFGL